MSKSKSKSGRPQGAKTHHLPPVDAPRSRCPKCGSTQRSKYFNVRTIDAAGTTPDGKPYTHVVWRRTKCEDCGQLRDDKSYEQRQAKKSKRR